MAFFLSCPHSVSPKEEEEEGVGDTGFPRRKYKIEISYPLRPPTSAGSRGRGGGEGERSGERG